METDTLTRSLVVVARTWFGRTYGNSYYTTSVIVDGVPTAWTSLAYGRGDVTYLDTAVKAARAAGVEGLPEAVRGWQERRDLEAAGWAVTVEEVPVGRKRDLHNGGKTPPTGGATI